MRSTCGSYIVRLVLTSVVISSDEHQYLVEAEVTTDELWLSFGREEDLSLIQSVGPSCRFRPTFYPMNTLGLQGDSFPGIEQPMPRTDYSST